MKRFNITVNGNSYDVCVEEVAEGTATTNVVKSAPAKKAVQQPKPNVASGIKVVSPMPGIIVDVKVNVGDMVKEGQPVVVLEAMKMENDVVALKDGKISSVVVKKGDNVNANDVLVTIE
ncbi:MAG: biotin/lipoyl-containing protein [Oscillospiraceae bacterium]